MEVAYMLTQTTKFVKGESELRFETHKKESSNEKNCLHVKNVEQKKKSSTNLYKITEHFLFNYSKHIQ